MSDTLVFGALIVGLLVFLIWKFDVINFTLEGLGFKAAAEGSRSTGGAQDQAPGSRTTAASGPGSVVVGGGAEQAKISTDVEAAGTEAAPRDAASAATEASGPGAVAVGGGAAGATIRTKVRSPAKSGGPDAAS